MPAPDHDFCRYVDRIKQDVGTHRALTSLAKHHALGSNLLLFCCWHPEQHSRRFTQKSLKVLVGATQPWHDRILQKLGHMADSSRYNKQLDADIKAEIEDLHSTTDHIEQLMLAETLSHSRPVKRSTQQIITDSCQNIAVYCKLLQVRLDDNDCELIGLILTTAHPTFRFEKALDIVKLNLLTKPKQRLPDHTQLKLRF